MTPSRPAPVSARVKPSLHRDGNGGENAGAAYVTLSDLVRLRSVGQGLTFLPKQPVHSILSGRHASRLRGRGLLFEDMRAYVPGDDIRCIDWKATARTRTTQLRVFTEERERPVLLVVDQSIGMFFGSTFDLKSVTAAHAAAIAVWRVLAAKDRIGAVVFDDTEQSWVRPGSTAAHGTHLLKIVADYNRSLDARRGATSDPCALVRALERAAQVATHDYLVVVISDFSAAEGTAHSEPLLAALTRIRRHNDVLLISVTDPLEVALPNAGTVVVSDGAAQAQIDSADPGVRARYRGDAPDNIDNIDTGPDTTPSTPPRTGRARLHTLRTWSRRYGMPLLPLSTTQPVSEQLPAALGHSPRPRRT